jgi:hypothetical protein
MSNISNQSMIQHPLSCPLEDVIGFFRDVMTPTDLYGDDYTEIGTQGNDVNWYKLAAEFVDPSFGGQGSVWLKNK